MKFMDDDAAEWKRRMELVPERVPLSEVATWWLDMWEWRTAEFEAGRGNMYDGPASYRAPWSLVVTKYPWVTVDDRVDLGPIVEIGMRRRARKNPAMKAWLKDYLKEKRDFEKPRR